VITDTEALKDFLVLKLKDISKNDFEDEGILKITSRDAEDRSQIAGVLSSVIEEHYSDKLIMKIVNHNYFYLNSYEKKKIYEKAVKTAKGENIELIKNSIGEYLETTDEIVLDGFVNFRLAEYIKRLERIVGISADEYVIEREYEEFISLLKTFSMMQSPEYETMHIVSENGQYRLYDEALSDITMKCMSEFMCGAEENMTTDDLLISILISAAPESICIHKEERIKNQELLTTIEKVFDGRVVKCNSCILCGG